MSCVSSIRMIFDIDWCASLAWQVFLCILGQHLSSSFFGISATVNIRRQVSETVSQASADAAVFKVRQVSGQATKATVLCRASQQGCRSHCCKWINQEEIIQNHHSHLENQQRAASRKFPVHFRVKSNTKVSHCRIKGDMNHGETV